MPRALPSTLLLAAALTGCTLIPPAGETDATIAATFPGGGSRSGGSTAADLPWRGFFLESRLRELIGYALANNRDLRAAMLNVQRTQAQYRIEKAGYYPTADAGGSFRRSGTDSATDNQWAATLGSVSYEVDLFGRVRSLNRQALERFFADAEGARSARILLVSQVAIQYFTLRQLEAQLVLARQTLAAVESSYQLNQITADAGATSELDLRTSEAQVQTSRINILTYERQILQARNALVLLLGRPLPDGLPEPREFGAGRLLADIPAGLPSDLLRLRPDIREAEHSLLAANANIGAARAAFFPSITLTASAGANSSELNDLLGRSAGVWNFSPQITVPIFTGGRNRASLDVAKISATIEIVNYEKTIQTAFQEVADALVARGSYRDQLDAQAALINAQERRYDLANERYRQGEELYLNVLSAQQDLYSSRQRLIQTQLDSLTNDIALYKALGGGWK